MNSIGLYLYHLIAFFIPETRCFWLKSRLLNACGADIAPGVRICSSVKILGSGRLSVGKDTWIGHDVIIVCSSRVTIGERVDIAPRVFVGTGTHVVTPNGDRIAGPGRSADVVIGNGAWLCANSTILPGVTVGEKSVVAAGAVVTADIEAAVIAAGVPAKRKKDLIHNS